MAGVSATGRDRREGCAPGGGGVIRERVDDREACEHRSSALGELPLAGCDLVCDALPFPVVEEPCGGPGIDVDEGVPAGTFGELCCGDGRGHARPIRSRIATHITRNLTHMRIRDLVSKITRGFGLTTTTSRVFASPRACARGRDLVAVMLAPVLVRLFARPSIV